MTVAAVVLAAVVTMKAEEMVPDMKMVVELLAVTVVRAMPRSLCRYENFSSSVNRILNRSLNRDLNQSLNPDLNRGLNRCLNRSLNPVLIMGSMPPKLSNLSCAISNSVGSGSQSFQWMNKEKIENVTWFVQARQCPFCCCC